MELPSRMERGKGDPLISPVLRGENKKVYFELD
jgi:hypothetical protein